ncbi:hypothetical protein ACS0TY_029038 [Phlomoides rotata]
MKQCLNIYERASGQLVNFDKFVITFSKKTTPNLKIEIWWLLNIKVTGEHDIYLGAPTFSLRQKRIQFGFLRNKITQKIEAWKFRFFSDGGKRVVNKGGPT